jgi:hypothetical protein
LRCQLDETSDHLVIAHRLSTVQNAGIVVLAHGRIVELVRTRIASARRQYQRFLRSVSGCGRLKSAGIHAKARDDVEQTDAASADRRLAHPVPGRTIRIDGRGKAVDRLYRQTERAIIAFWHARLLMIPCPIEGVRTCSLASMDGELIHRMSPGSVQAVGPPPGRAKAQATHPAGAVRVDLMVTPDGPVSRVVVNRRGPFGQATGLPIVPLTFSCSKKSFQLGSSAPIRQSRLFR